MAGLDNLERFFGNNNVVLFGMTGVGKTTLMNGIQRLVPIRYVSLGEISRTTDPRTPQGSQVNFLMERGGTWPISVISGLVEPYLDIKSPFVLDGVPKHPHEAEWLRDYLVQNRRTCAGLVITAAQETIQMRLQLEERAYRPETPEQTQDRIDVYNRNIKTTLALLEPVMPQVLFVENEVTSVQDTIKLIAERCG